MRKVVIRSKATEVPLRAGGCNRFRRSGPWSDKLDQLLLANEAKVARERLTLIRLFEELCGLGYDGGCRAAARLILRILNGESASTIPVNTTLSTKLIFDWRQMQRWGISESLLPPESEISFRESTAWERYRSQIMLIAAVLALQTALIVVLYYERRRRRSAEAVSSSAMARLAQMNRVATAGELTASITHEITQPIAAMVTNARAGLRWLSNRTPDLEEVRAALTGVINGGDRASEVIRSVRAMFKKDGQETTLVDLNDLIRNVLRANAWGVADGRNSCPDRAKRTDPIGARR